MTMVVMAVVMMDHHYHLRLRRVGQCEAEEKGDSEESLFHTLVSRLSNPFTELL
jgi:hypothetical protein